RTLSVSALKGSGIDKLEDIILENIWHEKKIDTHGILVSNLRHINALKAAQETLARALRNLDDGLSLEFISEEIKVAVNFLDSITGRNIDEDLLDAIFSQFCIGK
ncbi:MAG: tRNA uridine-5-carboxymethylaminomethyl(34) synthesis GTPase MnmE, partial [Candidatus Omnitrophica bacterium]|nr:tRNA uridine-5-carboxymethylaminomethyl(34) synthesis GTPase MnmE [Candidatus Omnitrophota bacterium]